MNTIAISGATGFVGGHLVRHFYNEGYNVLALGRQKEPPKRLLQYASWQYMDLSQFIKPIHADILIHTAGLVNDHSSYSEFHKINSSGSVNIFDAFQGKHMIHISSASVYNHQTKSIREDQEMDRTQLSNYGKSKLVAEELLIHRSKKNNRLTILRPRAIYGTHDRVLLPKILGLIKGNKIRSIGNMEIDISMTHIKNLIAAIEASIENQSTPVEVFNIADNRTYNLKEVVLDTASTLFEFHPYILAIPKFIAEWIYKISTILHIKTPITKQAIDYLSKSCVLNIDKIANSIGYQPKHNFENEISNINKWVKRIGLDVIMTRDKNIPWMV